jgi:hypothetical protein
MTISIRRVRTAGGAFSFLESLSRKDVRFRGQRNHAWRLKSTLARHLASPFSSTTTYTIDEMIDQFIVTLNSIGIDPPFVNYDRRGRLEFARHYGVPSPLIDFSHSPYVALFFAFNGARPISARKKGLFYNILSERLSTGLDMGVDDRERY